MISENEWLTIADNIIRIADNDIYSDIEGLQLASSTATTTSLVLSSGGIINNFVSGLGEWTDNTITKANKFIAIKIFYLEIS